MGGRCAFVVASDVRLVRRSSSALIIIALAALVIVLVAFPTVGETVRSIVDGVFGGETLLDVLGGIASIIGIFSAIIVVGRWTYGKLFGRTSNASGNSDDKARAVQETCDYVNKVAQQVSEFAAEFENRKPYRLKPGEELRTDFDSPEYQAWQREKGVEYDELMDELEKRYRAEVRLNVGQARRALAEQGIVDAQLDDLYPKANNAAKVDTIARLLWDMAGRLKSRGSYRPPYLR